MEDGQVDRSRACLHLTIGKDFLGSWLESAQRTMSKPTEFVRDRERPGGRCVIDHSIVLEDSFIVFNAPRSFVRQQSQAYDPLWRPSTESTKRTTRAHAHTPYISQISLADPERDGMRRSSRG